MEWVRLTRRPGPEFCWACPVGQWSRCRWAIALFVRVLKPGWPSERWRVPTAQRWLHALAMDVSVAWRLHNLTMVGRASPEVSCEVVCAPREWRTLSTMQPHGHPPPTPPPLRAMVRGRAQLGGFFARTREGTPGMQAIWQGYQRLHDFI